MIKVPPNRTLLPFQEEAVQKMLEFIKAKSSCYNASEMGLGKTIQAIVTCNTLSCGRILVICPAIVRYVWEEEFKLWSTIKGLRICNVFTSSDVRDSKNSNVTICSYNLASIRNVGEFLGSQSWDCLIGDEFHYVKSARALRTKSFFKNLWPSARYKIALSGTPFTNSIADGWTAFHHMLPNEPTFKTFTTFTNNYCYQRQTPWGVEYTGVKNHEELSSIIRSNFYLRYKKEDVLKDLPDKTFQKIELPSTFAVKLPAKTDEGKDPQKELEEVLHRLSEGHTVVKTSKTFAGVRKLQGEAKLTPIAEFIKELLDGGTPVVVFGYHVSFLKQLEITFKDRKPSVITGEVSGSDRQLRVQEFQNGTTDLFIGQYVAAGVGITLTRSSTVVLGELDWSPSNISQAVDRVHRIGAKNAVMVYWFCVKGSIDERIAQAVMDKVRTFGKVVEAA